MTFFVNRFVIILIAITSVNGLRGTVRRAAAARGGLDRDVIHPSALESRQSAI